MAGLVEQIGDLARGVFHGAGCAWRRASRAGPGDQNRDRATIVEESIDALFIVAPNTTRRLLAVASVPARPPLRHVFRTTQG
jgi:hypothetical protein